jgi:hypothetical protein
MGKQIKYLYLKYMVTITIMLSLSTNNYQNPLYVSYRPERHQKGQKIILATLSNEE